MSQQQQQQVQQSSSVEITTSHYSQGAHKSSTVLAGSGVAVAASSAGTTQTTSTLRSVINNHHKIQRISLRFQRIKAVYNLNRCALSTDRARGLASEQQQQVLAFDQAERLKGAKLELARDEQQHNGGQQALICVDLLNEMLAEIDHFTLDWRRHALDCLKMISESPNCTNIIITRLPLVVALAHLACLGLGEFFEVDQVYSASKTSKEACIKRIKKRFGANNRCSYIIIGGRDDVEMAKRLDLPSWQTSRSDGHRQLLQLHTALKEGYLM